MIPKIIHRVLFGTSFPGYVEESWNLSNTINYDWDHMTHNYENINDFPITKNFWDLSDSYSFKSDMVRLEALYNWGGFYIDTDIFVLRSFNSLINSESIIVAAECDDNYKSFGSAVIGSPAKNQNILNLINLFLEYAQEDASNPAVGEFSHKWKAFLPRLITDLALKNNENIIEPKPFKYFYPVPWSGDNHKCPKIQKDESASNYLERISSFISTESYCVHGWSGSWLK